MAKRNKPDHYARAGVDIDAGNRFVEDIKPIVKRTRRPGMLSDIGMFAGMFTVDRNRYQDPVLVSGCDGVGTKLLVAAEAKVYQTIGIDLVAMSVNDVLVHGAEPLFFLDYLACGALNSIDARGIVTGIAAACEEARCALLGGETAEMPGLYGKGHFDLAGFAVGVVERDQIIDGSAVRTGSTIIGIASSGLHSNGYSLARKVLLKDAGLKLDDRVPELSVPLVEELLRPTRIYVRSMLAVFERANVLAAAHITGGGLLENIPRVLPKSAKAVLDFDTWPKPSIFGLIQRLGNLPDETMFRVFNCGIGFVCIVREDEAPEVLEILQEQGERAWIVGRVEPRTADEPAVSIRRAG